MEFSELFHGGPLFTVGDGGVFAPGTDAVALSDFADVKFAKNICDIGCGCGVLAITAAMKAKSARVTAIDIQSEATDITLSNIAVNGLDGKIDVLCRDVREYKSLFESGSFDYIVTNPPYFPVKSGKHSESAEIARQEISCTLKDIVAASSYMLKYGGYLAMVHRADRAAEVIYELSKASLEPKVLRFVQHTQSSAPSLLLVKCKKGGKKGVTVMKPLILYNEDGTRSDELFDIWNKKGWQ